MKSKNGKYLLKGETMRKGIKERRKGSSEKLNIFGKMLSVLGNSGLVHVFSL